MGSAGGFSGAVVGARLGPAAPRSVVAAGNVDHDPVPQRQDASTQAGVELERVGLERRQVQIERRTVGAPFAPVQDVDDFLAAPAQV